MITRSDQPARSSWSDQSRARQPLWVVPWFLLPSVFVFWLMVVFLVSSFSITGRDALYPRAVIVLLLVVSALNLITDFRASRKFSVDAPRPEPELDADDDVEGKRGKGIDVRRTLLACAVLAVFPIVTSLFGFFVGVGVLIIGCMWILGVQSFRTYAIATVAMVGSAYLVFEVALGANLPPGLVL